MDFWTAAGVVRRWWALVAIALAVTAALTAGAYLRVKPEYRASGSLILLLPDSQQEGASAGAFNPWSNFDGSLNITADAIATVVTSDPVHEQLLRAGVPKDFTVTRVGQTPTITIEAQAATRPEAVGAVRTVMKTIGEQLASRQKAIGAPKQSWVNVSELTSPDEATKQTSAQLRAAVTVSAFGLIAALSLAFAAEYLAGIRGEREQADTGDRESASVDDDEWTLDAAGHRPAAWAAPRIRPIAGRRVPSAGLGRGGSAQS